MVGRESGIVIHDPSLPRSSAVINLESAIYQQQSDNLQSAMLGLYLHIPFCSAICNYCNFNRGLFEAGLKARYVDALEKEIRKAGGSQADTIYFGGGTPLLLEPPKNRRLVAACG